MPWAQSLKTAYEQSWALLLSVPLMGAEASLDTFMAWHHAWPWLSGLLNESPHVGNSSACRKGCKGHIAACLVCTTKQKLTLCSVQHHVPVALASDLGTKLSKVCIVTIIVVVVLVLFAAGEMRAG